MFQWILSIMESSGYAGIFFLMILETVFPPIPSEVVLPLAGFASARGDLNIIIVILVTTLGGLVGCMPWYLLGRLYGIRRLKHMSEKYGRILTLTPDDIEDAQAWFNRHGHLAVLFGRLMPTVRSLISVPAGIAKMPIAPFLFYSFIGTAIWNMLLLFSGYVLESQYEKISGYVDFFSNAIIVSFVSIYVYRVVTYTTREKKNKERREARRIMPPLNE
jgi:membrane protein DedA with SNARE-associated domain